MTEIREDIVAARGRMRHRRNVRRELADLPSQVAADEAVLALTQATHRARIGLLTLTDRRLMWSLVGLFRLHTEYQEYPVARITDVRWEAGRLAGLITVVVDGADLAPFGSHPSDGERLVDHALRLLGAGADRRNPPLPQHRP